MPRFARSVLTLIAASSSPLSIRPATARPAFVAFAKSPTSTSRTCASSNSAAVCASTMAPIAETTPEVETTSLPRWDLGKFGFATPFSEDIDSHLDETAKLAEAFKVSTNNDWIFCFCQEANQCSHHTLIIFI